jgi:predicted HAD superfamily Cof-like phosphohydrolase
MKKQLEMVRDFHIKYLVPYAVQQPSALPSQLVELRYKLMAEEVEEWRSAFDVNVGERKKQRRQRAKELADILYVVLGTVLTEGLQDFIEEVFDEVHRSNMTKDGTKRADGKILKGEYYKAPDLNFIE